MGIFGAYGLTLGAIALAFILFFKLIRIVPEQEAWIVEEFGKFKRALGPGFHLVIPFVQRVAYRHHLKEEAVDVEPQVCITKDNVQVHVDGVLYLMVVDAERASYGIDNYRFATAQLAQTTMRSEIGKIDLDNSFSERDRINDAVVKAVDEASDPWGIKVTRYEIKDITPTDTVMRAMEQQVKAEREKRAEILKSEGERESKVNESKGDRQHAINLSEGERQKRMNEADGRAEAIEIVANATAEGIGEVAKAIQHPKGRQAITMRIAEQFIGQLGDILEHSHTQVLPYDIAQIKGVLDGVLGNRGDIPSVGGRAGSSTDSTGSGARSAGSGRAQAPDRPGGLGSRTSNQGGDYGGRRSGGQGPNRFYPDMRTHEGGTL